MKRLSILFVLFAAACSHHDAKLASESPAPTFGTWVFADEKAGAEEVRKQYLDGAMNLAKEAGMQEVQGFAAKKVLMGELTPEFIGLFAWPSAEAARNLREGEAYTQRYGPLRPLGWDQLVAVDVNLSTPPAWQFEKGRYYTIALVWTKSAEAYQRYVTATADLREAMGFSILYSEPVVNWTTLGLSPDQRAPDRVALLSWPDASVPDRYLKALAAEPYSSIADATFEGISWHEVMPY